MALKKIFDGVNEEGNCEGSGNCCDCNLFDCYYNDTINLDLEGLEWNAEMDILEGN